jgi:hypothetical protein
MFSLSQTGSFTDYQSVYKQQFTKTAMCRFFAEGTCSKGGACPYAHSPSELMPKPVLTKARLCKELLRSGVCANRDTCVFAHEVTEVARSNSFFKSKICQYGAACKVGDHCRYAHSSQELRAPVLKAPVDFGLESPDDGFALRKGGVSSFTSTHASSFASVVALREEVSLHDHRSELYLD